jgi:hypothetical protein
MRRLVVAALLVAAAPVSLADIEDWPREISVPDATVVLYTPQVEIFEDNDVTARAAFSVTTPEAEPLFGAVWLTFRVNTDRDTRMVEALDVTVDRIRVPDASEEDQRRLSDLLEREIPGWDLSISLDRLLALLDVAETRRLADENLSNAAPRIVFAQYPTVLVLIDGKPQMRPIEDSGLMEVINTPFYIVFDTASQLYYLDGGEIWFMTAELDGPWQETPTVPAEVVEHRPPQPPDEEGDAPEGEDEAAVDDRVPHILIATEPTELIVTDGEPSYTPLPGSDLLYVSNTDSDVLLEVATQRTFVLLSGRWFASKSLQGPWDHVPSDGLPSSFAEIPEDSEVGYLRTFVAGTQEAKEAVLDNQIPQTSAVKRSEAELEVTYDGLPDFEPIEGTGMKYAVNTGFQVIQVGTTYYACHQAVWFVSLSPLGPWEVADEIPSEIYTIPPSSPVYNVKYVYIYDSTPEVVYVGYYPGYVGSYVHAGCVVYGTGFYYPGWHGTVYYARPATWGFHVRYNPWWGWSFGFSYSTGRFTFSIGFGRPRGWWGPVGYRSYRRGFHHGYRRGAHAGFRAGYRAGQRSSAVRQNNLYNRPENRARNADRKPPAAQAKPSTGAAGRPNNVYADKNGNVHRRNESGGWEKREGNGWKQESAPGRDSRPSTADRGGSAKQPSTGGGSTGSKGQTKPSTGASASKSRQPPSTGSSSRSAPSSGYSRSGSASGLNRDYSARQRGSTRTNNYRSSGSYGGSRGGSRSGGGRRR